VLAYKDMCDDSTHKLKPHIPGLGSRQGQLDCCWLPGTCMLAVVMTARPNIHSCTLCVNTHSLSLHGCSRSNRLSSHQQTMRHARHCTVNKNPTHDTHLASSVFAILADTPTPLMLASFFPTRAR
jgi:hypothetical protein